MVNAAMSSAEKKKQVRAKFEGVYQVLRKDLLEHFAGEGMPKDAVEWYGRVCAVHISTPSSYPVVISRTWIIMSPEAN
jgi:hypothetical protein